MSRERRVGIVILSCLLILGSLTACAEKLTVVEVIPPAGLMVEKGTRSSSLELPAELEVKLSDGQGERRKVTWDTSLLPERLDASVKVKGQIEDGVEAEISIQVVERSQLLQIGEEEAASEQALAAMEEVLSRLPNLAFAPTWSRQRHAVALVLDYEILYLWRVGEARCIEIGPIGTIATEAEWSYDDRYFWVDTGTSPARGCVIVDAEKGQVVETLDIEGTGKWAPDRNVLLVGLFNKEIILPWRAPEYPIDLALYDVENRQVEIIMAATSEYEFWAKAWDGSNGIVYEKHYFEDRRVEEGRIYIIED